MTGEPVCGPEILSEEELVGNRENMWASSCRANWTGRTTASAAPILQR